MTVALLVRDSAVARLLAHRVADSFDLRLVVVESGRDARRAKLGRELRRGFPWRLPLALLDLAALGVYQFLWRRYAVSCNRENPVPPEWPAAATIRVNNANDPAAVEALAHLKPDVCLVLGTAILRGPTLRAGGRCLLNIHGGIVPAYRNVHSEFWAVMRNDYNNVGVTVMHLDEGIDTGAIALQRRLPVEPGEPLFSIRHRNNRLAVDTGIEALAAASAGPLPSVPQEPSAQGFFKTPRLVDFARLATRAARRRLTRKQAPIDRRDDP